MLNTKTHAKDLARRQRGVHRSVAVLARRSAHPRSEYNSALVEQLRTVSLEGIACVAHNLSHIRWQSRACLGHPENTPQSGGVY